MNKLLSADYAMQASTITSWARLVWSALQYYGHEPVAVFEEAGLDPSALHNANARYPVSRMIRLWGLAEAKTQDPCFGLVASSYWHPTTWHALGYSWLASKTLFEAFERLVRYSTIITDVAEMKMEESREKFRFTIRSRSADLIPPGITMDTVLATLVSMCRKSYGEEFKPLLVTMVHEDKGCGDRFTEFFRASIQYSAPEYALCVGKQELTEPLATANIELARANDQVIVAYLAKFNRDAIVMRVKDRLIDQLPTGNLTEESVAEALNMSQRSLQRKLRDEGTTYKQVLDKTRRELAEKYIESSLLTLNEIAYLLGFAEPSSFSRSFKRWNGVSPSFYRDSIQSNAKLM